MNLVAESPEEKMENLAHEIWAVAQTSPGEGIEDGVQRILDLLKETVIMKMDDKDMDIENDPTWDEFEIPRPPKEWK
ncbi:hypothetical protein EVB64_120 [Rhizobium phage RHph_TM61]|nr:hypothetical protein EVB61_118 [Rhizobium phage RHph_TM21B]QIG77707.1 hypothetical protein EVB64_120 [Rhizobium phage RHph_TM61]